MPNPIKPPKLGSTLGSTLGNQSGQSTDVGKMGKQGAAVKTPKMKKPGDAFAPPSVFFKSENEEPKHANLKKLHNFLKKKHKI